MVKLVAKGQLTRVPLMKQEKKKSITVGDGP